MTAEPEVVESTSLVLQTTDPSELVQRATRIADALAAIIEKKRLYREISGRRFVVCEGWTTLAAMNGVMPRELTVSEEDGVFTATVELVHLATGNVVGRASAECGAPDELDRKGQPLWSARPRYARRSMALTRATSKACRLTFSWIMALGGLEVTPAEEVPPGGFEEDRTPPRASQAPKNGPPAENGPRWKGKPMREMPTDDLIGLRAWFVKQDPKKWEQKITEVDETLAARGGE